MLADDNNQTYVYSGNADKIVELTRRLVAREREVALLNRYKWAIEFIQNRRIYVMPDYDTEGTEHFHVFPESEDFEITVGVRGADLLDALEDLERQMKEAEKWK